jgi:AAA+ ATPase superfamily predicted ATPase
MRFYNREQELSSLERVHKLAATSAKMTVITGRRRIGKTRLIMTFAEQRNYLYFFIAKKNEAMLCAEFVGYIKEKLKIPVFGEITALIDIFRMLFAYAEAQSLVLIIDEFQELYNLNPAIISEIQKLWDMNKDRIKLHLIISGSTHSMLHKIFQNAKEPLFGRADQFIIMQTFPKATLKEILSDAGQFTPENLLALYMLTGGIPRYIEILHSENHFTKDAMIDFVFSPNSPFIDEGKFLLIEEFGKDYQMYFSILELISSGKTSRSEIESVLSKSVGGYLERMEHDYNVIEPYRPIYAKKGVKNIKLKLKDPFLSFWFAYLYRYRSALEANNLQYIKNIFIQNYSQYGGYWLQRLWQDIYNESGKYNLVGSYWEKNFQNEIDIVAIDDQNKTVVMAEVKMQSKNIRISQLQERIPLIRQLVKDDNYTIHAIGLSLDDLVNV